MMKRLPFAGWAALVAAAISCDKSPAGQPNDGPSTERPAVVVRRTEPLGARVGAVATHQATFRVASLARPQLELRADGRAQPLVAATELSGGVWEARLQALGNSERGLLLLGVGGRPASVALEWAFEGPRPDVESEVHAYDGELGLTLPVGTPEGARVSILKVPGGGQLAGPFELSGTAEVTQARAVFSPGGFEQGFPAEVAARLAVLEARSEGGWAQVEATVHPELGRVAFQARLPGTYMLVIASETPK